MTNQKTASWEEYRDAARAALVEGDFAQSEVLFSLAVSEAEAHGASDIRVAAALTDLSEALVTLDKEEEALAALERAKDIVTTNPEADDEDIGLVSLYLGDSNRRLARYEEARQAYQTALEHLGRMDNSAQYPHALICEAHLAGVHCNLGNPDEGERLLRHLVSEIDRRTSMAPTDMSVLYSLAAELSHVRGHVVQAELLYRSALDVQAMAGFEPTLDTADTLNNLGCLYDGLQKWDLGRDAHERALGIRRSKLEADSTEIAQSLVNLAAAHRGLGDLEAAERLIGEAVEVYTRLGRFSAELLRVISIMGGLMLDLEKWDVAEQYFREALAHPSQLDKSAMLNNIAVALRHQGKTVEALALYREAVEVARQVLGPDHHRLVVPLKNLAGFLFDEGQLDEVENLTVRALEIVEAAGEPDVEQQRDCLELLAEFYEDSGRQEDLQRVLAMLDGLEAGPTN